MSIITREQAELRSFINGFLSDPAHDNQSSRSMTAEVFRIALASLEAEAVGYVDAEYAEFLRSGHIESCSVYAEAGEGCITLYAAPPAPVAVTKKHNTDYFDTLALDTAREIMCDVNRRADFLGGDIQLISRIQCRIDEACRAAMPQGADTELQCKAAIHDALCEKYNVESLSDFVDWQRNHIAELEAAPPAPVGKGETAVMPDYPGYVMTQRECFEAGKKAGLAEAGNSPVVPDGLRLALSNAGIAAPEPDEMLAATCEKHIQALVSWVKDRKPFRSTVNQDGWVACSERMPEREIDVQVYCSDKKEQMVGYMERNERDGYFRFASLPNGGGVYCQPTHWMPLPAAPQQEVK